MKENIENESYVVDMYILEESIEAFDEVPNYVTLLRRYLERTFIDAVAHGNDEAQENLINLRIALETRVNKSKSLDAPKPKAMIVGQGETKARLHQFQKSKPARKQAKKPQAISESRRMRVGQEQTASLIKQFSGG